MSNTTNHAVDACNEEIEKLEALLKAPAMGEKDGDTCLRQGIDALRRVRAIVIEAAAK